MDLEETYGRCLERINLSDVCTVKVMKWISFAARPLHIEELKEAVAFDVRDTAWDQRAIPSRDFVIGCCANLVVVDPLDSCVSFAHSSVESYLRSQARHIPGYPDNDTLGKIECGEFCVAYLSFSNFGLELSTSEISTVNTPSPLLSS